MSPKASRRSTFCRRALALALLPLLAVAGTPVGARAQSGQPAQPDPATQPAPATQAGAPAVPQEPPAVQPGPGSGRTVEAIEFRGTQALSEETLLFYLGLKVGQPLDEEQLDAAIKRLWDRGLVDDIRVESAPSAGGVRLTITVAERPVLRSIDYEGLKRISRTDIQDKITSRRIRAREGDPMSLGELQRIKGLIEELYQDKGYRFAQARYTVEDIGPNEKRVVFTVDEGDRVRIADIEFEGNEVFSDARLRLAMKKTKESGLISRLMKRDIYNPATLQEDLDKVRDIYRGAGYKNVVLGEPQLEARVTNPKAAPAQQKRRLFLTIPIEEGDRWKFGGVTIEGNEVYADEILLARFERRSGAWLRSKLVDEGVKAIQDLYNNTGYIFARVEPELVEKSDQVADVVVHVTEGEQYKVGRIEFEGNDRTQDKVLRRELRLQEGRVVSIAALRNSVTKVNQLGYFKLDQEDPVKIDYDSEDKEVDLVFKGEEAERTELQFGGGWSEIDEFFGQFAINTKNFLGRGETVGFSLQTGKIRNLFDVSYYVPWFLDKPQSIGFRAFDQELDYRQLNALGGTQRTKIASQGGVLTYGRNLGLFQQVAFSYNRSRYEDEAELSFFPDDGTGTGGDPTDTVSRLEIDTSSVTPIYVYDSRDNPFEPVRGQRFSLSTEYAGGFLGGDSYFVRPQISYSLFQPVTGRPARTVFAINVEGGLVDPFGGRELTRLDRFYLGGENSIRGHRRRTLTVRDPRTDRKQVDELGLLLGGDKYVQLNLEYHFLLGGPFRVLLFADAANVYGEDQSIDLSRLRYTAGAELRVLVPVFGAPLRFIYAFNLDPLPQDEFEEFQFSIGTSF